MVVWHHYFSGALPSRIPGQSLSVLQCSVRLCSMFDMCLRKENKSKISLQIKFNLLCCRWDNKETEKMSPWDFEPLLPESTCIYPFVSQRKKINTLGSLLGRKITVSVCKTLPDATSYYNVIGFEGSVAKLVDTGLFCIIV